MSSIIKNKSELTQAPGRQEALEILEAGINAIDTKKVVKEAITLDGNKLVIKGLELDLDKFNKIRVLGFGKASSDAAEALEGVLGGKISNGAVVDIKKAKCNHIDCQVGSHPRPTSLNVVATQHITNIAKLTGKDDLVLVIVSGGGSALLCSSEEECGQGERLYSEFLKVGGNIDELNLVRKHLSELKGGGLAKLLYPARVVGLIFSDIPGDRLNEVASGPTYKDNTTAEEAQTVLDGFGLKDFELTETPKEDKYFENVTNIEMVSNHQALEAMRSKAEGLGYEADMLSNSSYDKPEDLIKLFKSKLKPHKVLLAGGEVELEVKGGGGSGGRNVQFALEALAEVGEGEVFASLASDGIDNSDAAGALADKYTLDKAHKLKLDIGDYRKRFDSYNFFAKTGDLINTGPTGANVSDLYLWLKL